jgi:hypothetical protein
MDIVPKNEFISLTTLETYIEKYPEDAEKWLEFIRDPKEEPNGKLRRSSRRYLADELDNEIYKNNSDLHNLESDAPIEHYNDGCLFCKKSWTSTKEVPTTTLICGHKFHTLCSMIDQYNGDTTRCIVDDCDINTWDYVRKIIRSKEKVREKAENILLSAYQKRADFKKDISELKKDISSVTSAHNKVGSIITNAKKDFVHKHLYTINQLQNDINENVKSVKESEEMHKYKQSVRNYRKKASYVFRKYHMSFRELREKGILRTSWRLRWILERHRSAFTYYKMGIRMYPGKKIWKDTLEQDEEVESDEENI